MAEMYFVRHGQSGANIAGLFAGQKEDSPLTDEGRQQAKMAAEDLLAKEIAITRIISSPLIRAAETAEIIARAIGFDKNEIEFDQRIAEYDMGELTGTPHHKVTSQELVSAPGAEDPQAFMERVHEVLMEMIRHDGPLLIVSHAGVGRIIETKRLNNPPSSFYDLQPYPNAQVVRLLWSD